MSHAPRSSHQSVAYFSYPREAIEIPVVFHVVYRHDEENVSDELILHQLEILNQDYNADNDDIASVPEVFKEDIGNPGITFCLAAVNDHNQPQSGIIRTETNIENIGSIDEIENETRKIKSTSLGGSDPWNTEKYLNIWIGARDDNGLGDATFPTEEDPNKIDGIVISYRVIADLENSNSRFNLGRTLTHEIGHYLNLLHLNGNESSCFGEGDFVEDTPKQSEIYFGQCQGPVSSCDSRDMDTNFMNFRDDDCLVFFTKGQVDRIMNTLFTTRFSLISSRICSNSSPIPRDPLEFATFFTLEDRIEISLAVLRNRDYELFIYDAGGRFINTIQQNAAHLYDLEYNYYDTGIYFVQLLIEGDYHTKKVFIP